MLRPLVPSDWPAVRSIESATYAPLGLSEDPEVHRSRAGESTSFVLSIGSVLAGYVLALPFEYGRFPALADVSAASSAPDPHLHLHDLHLHDLHLHDLAVAAEHRGSGLGSRLAEHLLSAARAQHYARVSLVSLGGSGAFWSRHGFLPRPEVPAPAGYGPGATYMSRPL